MLVLCFLLDKIDKENVQVYVIIGMPADKLTYQNKGKTVMLENERMEVSVSPCHLP